MINKYKKAIFFAPGTRDFFEKWSWYQSDLMVLKQTAEEVLVCFNLSEFLLALPKTSFIYCTWWHQSIIPIIFGKLLKKPVLVTGAIHMFDRSGVRHYYKANFLYRLLNKLALRFADANLFISQDQYISITNNIYVNNPRVVYSSLKKNALEYDQVINFRNSQKKNKVKFIEIVTVLWQTPDTLKRKGVWECLNAIKKLSNEEKSNIRWTVLGKRGEGTNKLRIEINKAKLNKIISIFENPTEDQKNKFLLNADIFLQPSWCEGLGLAVIEAAALGALPVVSKYTAQPETVPDNRFIPEDMKPGSIAKTLSLIINLKKDDRDKAKKKAMKYVHDKFSFEKHLKEVKKILRDLNIKKNN